MNKRVLYWINPTSKPDNFPPIHTALNQPDGLLCFGGDLTLPRLLAAYRRGIFPWYVAQQPIMWWSPSPRCVILPNEFKISRSLAKVCRKDDFYFSMDQAFAQVVKGCAAPRDLDRDTWITKEMQLAYQALHQQGYAHSVEVWQNKELVGGLYGLALGQVFFGESMFSKVSNASKIALACLHKRLVDNHFQIIDCQVSSFHLISLGAREISRQRFARLLNDYCDVDNSIDLWQTKPILAKAYLFIDERCLNP